MPFFIAISSDSKIGLLLHVDLHVDLDLARDLQLLYSCTQYIVDLF